MLQVIGATLFVVLAYTVLTVAAGFSGSAAFLIPLIGLAAGWSAFGPNRTRRS
jgi:hypothetical protein